MEVLAPEGDLCAGVPYPLEAIDAAECVTIEWVVILKPAGVNDADIIFSAPNSEETNVTVPIEGRYRFGYNCGVVA